MLFWPVGVFRGERLAIRLFVEQKKKGERKKRKEREEESREDEDRFKVLALKINEATRQRK